MIRILYLCGAVLLSPCLNLLFVSSDNESLFNLNGKSYPNKIDMSCCTTIRLIPTFNYSQLDCLLSPAIPTHVGTLWPLCLYSCPHRHSVLQGQFLAQAHVAFQKSMNLMTTPSASAQTQDWWTAGIKLFSPCSLIKRTHIFILYLPGELCSLHCAGVWEC